MQALAEPFAVLTRKARWTPAAATAAVMNWHDSYGTTSTSPSVLIEAMELVANHLPSFWDAMILASAVQSGCRLLMSEDLQDGFT